MFDRRGLALIVVAMTLTRGCLGAGGTPSSTPSPAGADTTEACSNDMQRLDADVRTGELPEQDADFEITTNRTQVSTGETITVHIRTVADAPRGTGTEQRFVLQRQVDGEWTTVLGARPGRAGWNATLVMHEPGEGFTWTVGLHEDGFGEWGYEPCGSLPAGEYRFVYHALVESGEFEVENGSSIPDPAVAAEFTLVE